MRRGAIVQGLDDHAVRLGCKIASDRSIVASAQSDERIRAIEGRVDPRREDWSLKSLRKRQKAAIEAYYPTRCTNEQMT